MAIHDWTRVDAGLFHDFHQSWIIELRNALNRGVLPPDYFALAEQRVQGPIPDILTLRLSSADRETSESKSDRANGTNGSGGLAVATAPPQASVVLRSEAELYAGKADRITVRHRHGDVVAVIEIVSPGNKASRGEIRCFFEELAQFVRHGIHLLVIDLFPPGLRDPGGLHRLIWEEIGEGDYELPAGKPLTLAAYDAGPTRVAYVEPVAVGDELPKMPLFVKPETYVPAPLEESYRATWETFPEPLKGLL
jgi:hypothetical protein